MGLYIMTDSGFEEIENKSNPIEKELEGILAKDPKPVLDGEDLIIIGRQLRTDLNKINDLLAIDNNGNIVIIELKKAETPRDVIAQVLEYTAWVSKLSYKELNKRYLKNGNRIAESLLAAAGDYPSISDEKDINKQQRIVIFARTIEDDIIEVSKYLREFGSIDIYCVEYNLYESSSGEKIFNTEIKVGSEQVGSKSEEPIIMTKEVFIDRISDNEIKDFSNDFFSFIEEFDSIGIKCYRTQITIYLNNRTWIGLTPWKNSFRVKVKGEFDDEEISQYSSVLGDLKDTREQYGEINFLVDSRKALDKFKELINTQYKRNTKNG